MSSKLYSALISLLILSVIQMAGCERHTQALPLRIGIHFWPGLEFLQIAHDQGFFAREGVTVNLVRFTSLADEQRAYEYGHVDGAYVSLDQVVIMNDRGIPARMVLVGDISKGGDGIIARPDHKSLADLRGARVGVTIGATNHFTLVKALQMGNVNEDEVEIINLPEDRIMDAFNNGQVDIAVTWEPELARNAHRQDAHILFTSAAFPDLIIDGIVFPPTILKKRHQEIQAMIRGWHRALSYAKQNPDATYAAIARYQNSDVTLMNTIFKGIEMGNKEVNQRVLGVEGMIGTGVHAAKQVSEFLLRFNLIKTTPDPHEMFVPIANAP
ncbi:MAG: ABC transporter substrate-binding protein [Magnetococcales bacterium]|nr:ABC transporter substrate-binding protein [Magnetococcales bacterium]